MNVQAGILGAMALVGLFSLIAWIVAEVRKGPTNKRTGLPPPSEACRRTPDPKNYEPLPSRRYIP